MKRKKEKNLRKTEKQIYFDYQKKAKQNKKHLSEVVCKIKPIHMSVENLR